jgi:hypothetical protein
MDRDRAISLDRHYRDRRIYDERKGGESVVVISDGEVVGLNYNMRYANETLPGTICVDQNDNVLSPRDAMIMEMILKKLIIGM